MMNELSGAKKDVLAAVDSVLAEKELMDQPRAFLLLRLCQLSLLFSPGKTEHYWSQLVPLKSKITKELQADLEDLRSIIESTSTSGAKGFAAEIISDVEDAKKLAASDVEEAKRRLYDCESRLKKRRWPSGKTPARIALVKAWAGVDRQYALQLINTIPVNVRESFIQRINRANPLLAEEWKIVADKAGVKQTVQIALKILEEEKPRLLLPRAVLLEVGAQIRNSMRPITTSQGEAELAKKFALYAKLVNLHVDGDRADLIPILLEELYVFLVETRSLDQIWPTRFHLIAGLLELGVLSKSLTDETLERLLNRTPSYLTGFVRAHYVVLSASPSEVENAYSGLLSKTEQDREAEAWFLVSLVVRGLGAKATRLAEKSDRAEELLPRLRRAWLCTHPKSAGSAISAADMTGDAVGEFLAQGAVQDRVTYLKETTEGGTRGVPGAMWAGAGTEEDPEGLRGFWKNLMRGKKTLDETVMQYLALNPLYSSYRRDTRKEEQFSENLRLSGYGEYKYQDVDGALLETLVAWGDEDGVQAQSVLRAMWGAIQPDDNILMVNFLRNAILTRCRNVFAAAPEMLIQDFLGWFKGELVDKGRYWQSGRTQISLKFPDTAPLQFCLASAMAVSKFSPSRRNQILLSGLGRFKGDPQLLEAAAQLYNAGKEVLDLTPPLQLEPKLAEAWQLGGVKYAIPFILRAMVAQLSE